MNYGKCAECKQTVRYRDVPLCESCMAKITAKLNTCIQNGAKTIKDMVVASGLPEKLVKALVLNGYVSVNQETKEIKEEVQEDVYKKLVMLRELKETIGKNSEPAVEEPKHAGMHYIGRHR